jgi:site-specific recombinase XerD
LSSLPTDLFLAHLRSTGKVQAAKTYGSLLVTFQRWLRDTKGVTIEQATTSHVEEYVSGVNSQETVLTAIREYLKFEFTSLPPRDPTVMEKMQRYNQLKMVRPKRKPRKLKKIALDVPELKKIISVLKEMKASEELIAGVVVLFYFGARPREFAEYLAIAKVSFEKREMFIDTAKTHVERYLAWHPRLTPYLRTWYDFVRKNKDQGLPYPGEWLTKRLKQEMGKNRKVGGVNVTSRTARRTFQTQMRLQGVPDIMIRAVLGHTSNDMGDVYTDWVQFCPKIRETMERDHYMIKSGVI